ncbi:hypothetical protein GCK72_017814 [Caenorhabditis remanei]|uniref:Uncharacterized protein n=1 Tax=Caenorhabditis remanei TaxID=31234 RepID=A0A6A5G8F1_CAERE|nr:hypothetical protein GCK72_017814 [Caenorhabditis remanei]KAF1751260.1 hypothetical protein GCK72_017814 [Caenorhabditis remanei]
MSSMKWVYFNMHFWMCCQSLMVSSLMTPVSWLPTASSSMMGLFSKLGIPPAAQAYAAGTVGTLSISAMISLFENRHNVIQQNRFRISNRYIRFSVVGINYMFALIYPMPFLFGIPDQDAAKFKILEIVPCPHEEFFELPVFTISINPEYRVYATIISLVCTGVLMLQLNVYAATCIYYLVFSKSKNSSRVTSNRQKKFFYGILIQISVPYGFLIPAVIYSCYSIFNNYYNQSEYFEKVSRS